MLFPSLDKGSRETQELEPAGKLWPLAGVALVSGVFTDARCLAGGAL